MSPIYTTANPRHGLLRDGETRGDLTLQPGCRADFSNAVGCQFSEVASFALIRAAFHRHIVHVLSLCAEKQVGRITARRMIAAMQNQLFIWNGAVSGFPCGPVGKNTSSSFSNLSISTTTVVGAGPQPALVRIRKTGQPCSHAFQVWAMLRQTVAHLRTKAGASVCASIATLEGDTALLTGQSQRGFCHMNHPYFTAVGTS